jgi:hypothetical protein
MVGEMFEIDFEVFNGTWVCVGFCRGCFGQCVGSGGCTAAAAAGGGGGAAAAAAAGGAAAGGSARGALLFVCGRCARRGILSVIHGKFATETRGPS